MSTNTFTPKTSEDPLLKAQVEDNETELVDHSNLIGILQNSVASNSTNISSVMNYTTIIGGQLAGTEPSGLKTKIDANTAKTGITSAEQTKLGHITIGSAQNLDNHGTQIDTNVVAINGIKDNTLSSNLKTAVDANTNKVGITTAQANNIESNATNVTLVINQANNNSAGITSINTTIDGIKNNTLSTPLKTAVDGNSSLSNDNQIVILATATDFNSLKNNTLTCPLKTAVDQNTTNSNNQLSTINGILNNTISSNLKTAVDSNTNELNNIIVGTDVMNYSSGRIGKVSGTSGFSIQNSGLNGGVLDDAFAGLKQSNSGKTIINGTTTDPISFRKNNVQEYSSNELKNLVDNITVSSTVNLNSMATNINTNLAKIGYPTEMGNLLSTTGETLEVGTGVGNPRIRLNGPNSVNNSSEIIFIDHAGNNPDYYQGFTLRYNSGDNIFQIGADNSNNNNPLECLRIDRNTREVQCFKSTVSLNEIIAKGSSAALPANANIMLTTAQGSLPGYANNHYPTIKTNFSNMYFSVGGNYSAFLASGSVGQIDFTGQHRCVPTNDNLINNVENNVGKIVISNGEICSLIKNEDNIFQPTSGKNGITINESIPKVELSSVYKDKRVLGVISNTLDNENAGEKHYTWGAFTTVIHSLENDNRLTINSLGEGAILVCNTQGNIENGDLITTSTLAGIGCKQDDDLVHSYTVAKATIDCNFDLDSNNYKCYQENENKIALISCIYLC